MTTSTPASQEEFANTIQATIDDLVAALSVADSDAMADCFAADATLTTMQGEFRGRDSIRQLFRGLMADTEAVAVEERGLKRRVEPPFGLFEGVEVFTMKDGTRYRLPYVAHGVFSADGAIVEWSRYSDRWLLVQQGARQLGGPRGAILRWFVSQVDAMLGKDLPAPVRPPA